ncbi:MAG: hypothetical protein EBT04_09180 [Betaproteobacteria bacterium]|nr:hypothetical protein [Betaproteobacteria bacterium]
MTDRELMKQALDAFGGLLTFNPSPAEYKQGRDVVAALRDRLAQPEQELVIDCPRCGHCCPKSNQEPVVLMDAPLLLNGQPLYTTPPHRPWVGLTDEDRQALAAEQHGWEGLCFAVEAKLKEKNT